MVSCSKGAKIYSIVTSALAVLMLIIFIPVGYKAVKYGYFGIRYNTISQRTMDDLKVWSSGRYFVGVGSKFLEWPAKQQLVDVNKIHIANNESSYELSVSVIYGIERDYIRDLYTLWGDFETYEKQLVYALRATFAKICTGWSFDKYYSEREEAQDLMLTALIESWRPMYATPQTVYLELVEFKDKIETQILNEQLAALNTTYMQEYGKWQKVQWETKHIQATGEAEIRDIYAESNASAITYEADARANIMSSEFRTDVCRINAVEDPGTGEASGSGPLFSNYDDFLKYEITRLVSYSNTDNTIYAQVATEFELP